MAIEAGCSQGWKEFVGDRGEVLGMDTFGASAPYKDLFKKFGFTSEEVVRKATALLRSHVNGQ